MVSSVLSQCPAAAALHGPFMLSKQVLGNSYTLHVQLPAHTASLAPPPQLLCADPEETLPRGCCLTDADLF